MITWLKQFLIRLFDIKVEDLPEWKHPPTGKLQIDDRTEKQIRSIVAQEIQLELDNYVTPEHRQTVVDLRKSELSEIVPSDSISEIDGENHNLEEEFPILEDEKDAILGDTPGLADEFEPETIEADSLPASHEIEETIFPIDDQVFIPEVDVDYPLTSIEEQELRIGIDFGTTTTSVSLKIGEEMPVPIPIGQDGVTTYIPSVAYIAPGDSDIESRVIVGEEAESYGDQTRVIRSIKRCLGCHGGYCFENQDGSSHPNNNRQIVELLWCRGDGLVHLAEGELYDPEEIATLIVKEAVRRAVEHVREHWHIDLTEQNVQTLPLNLGCGAKFNLLQRKNVNLIASELGFSQTTLENIVEEPILAGFTFSRFAENPTGRILIYDFGGGTFDVAVLEVDRSPSGLRVTILSTDGEQWLGGDDIDNLVLEYFLVQISEENQVPVDEILSRMEKIDQISLRNAARQAKEQLSDNDVYDNVIFSNALGTISLNMTKAILEEILEKSGLIDMSLEATERACRLAYVYDKACESTLLDGQAIIRYGLRDASKMIDRVVLVGGVTKIPYVREKIFELFGNKIVEESIVEPISAVSVGASYPRDPHHYSLSTPPSKIFIEGESKHTNGKVKRTIFEPYEPYLYHEFWAGNARPSHIKFINLKEELIKANIYYQKIGQEKVEALDSIGRMLPGDWKFYITLEGAICVQRIGEKVVLLNSYPTIHPVQIAIRESMRKRWQESYPRDNRTFEECMKDIISEK